MATSGKPLPWSIRDKILKLLGDGFSRRQVAAILRVSKRTVDKYAGQKNLLTSVAQ